MSEDSSLKELRKRFGEKKKSASKESFQEKFRKGFGGGEKTKKLRTKTTLQKLFSK